MVRVVVSESESVNLDSEVTFTVSLNHNLRHCAGGRTGSESPGKP
jgi:hypothetical protein